MAAPFYSVGLGPFSLEDALTFTLLAPADTNGTTNLIKPMAPLGRGANDSANNLWATRCADGEVPRFIAIHRQDLPDGEIGVMAIPNARAGLPPAARFVAQLPYTGAAGSGLRRVLADGAGAWKLVAAALAAAVRHTGVVASNNAILWTAKNAGLGGNAVRVALVDPAGNNAVLAVTVAGNDVTVSLATGAGGAITSTAALVIAAVNANPDANDLLTAANDSTSNGTGVVTAAAMAALAGGTAEGIGEVLDNPTTSGGFCLVMF